MPENQTTIANQEITIDLEGTSQQENTRILVDEDAYDGIIRSIRAEQTKKYGAPNEKTTKIIFTIMIVDIKQGEVELSLFCNPKIVKSSGTKGFDNSKLYNILDKAHLLTQIAQDKQKIKTIQGLTEWLITNLGDKKVRVLVKTTNKGKQNAYSSINDIVKFV